MLFARLSRHSSTCLQVLIKRMNDSDPRGGHLASQSSALGAQEGRQGQAGCEVGRREHSMGCPAGRLQESAGVAQDECNTNE